MAQDEPARARHRRYPSGLRRRRVAARSRLVLVVAQIGRLVVDRVDARDVLGHRGLEHRVRAVGIADGRLGIGGEERVGDDLSLGGDEIRAVLDVGQLGDGNVVELYHVAPQMAFLRFLAEQEADRRHAVVERKRLDRQGLLVKDDAACGLNFVVDNVKGSVAAENLHDLAQDVDALAEGVDGYGAPRVVERQG